MVYNRKIENVLVAAVRALLEELTPPTRALLVWALG